MRKLGLLTDNNTTTISSAAASTAAVIAGSNNNGESTSTQQQRPHNNNRRQSAASKPPKRRSLPRRKSKGGNNNNNDDDEQVILGGYESESSVEASPVKIRRILLAQPHQEELSEGHLKQYQKTRRLRRGRPKLHEYEYKCDESCKECGVSVNFNFQIGHMMYHFKLTQHTISSSILHICEGSMGV